MPTTEAGFVHYNVDDPEDLLKLIDNGLIWKTGAHGQELAVQALIAGKTQLNDKVPPQIAAYVQTRLGGTGQ